LPTLCTQEKRFSLLLLLFEGAKMVFCAKLTFIHQKKAFIDKVVHFSFWVFFVIIVVHLLICKQIIQKSISFFLKYFNIAKHTLIATKDFFTNFHYRHIVNLYCILLARTIQSERFYQLYT